MSDQTWPPKNPDSEGNSTPPPDGPAEPTPPAEPGPYTEPPAYQPPSAPETPPSYSPPAGGGYSPSPVDPYGQSPSAGYQTPYPQQGDPYGQQPGGYGQQPGPYGQPQPGGYGQPADPYPPAGGYPAQPYSGPTPTPPATYSGGGALVDWPKRALGGLIDYVAPAIVFSIITNILSNVAGSTVGGLVSFVLGVGWWIYLGYKSGTTGITFGRSIAKTKLVSEATGQPIGVSNGIVRQLAHIIDSIICYIGWLFPLWDSKRQTIADKLMKTVVIDNSADPNAGNYDWNIQR
jgi:uncharacterized RDD family membrane protein YckC